MHDLTFPELNEFVSKDHPGFCLGETEALIRLVQGVPVSGKWHSFATIFDPAASHVMERMRELGFADGDPVKNLLKANPRVAFLRVLHRALGVAYNVHPMVHHGSDLEAKEGMLNLLYSVYHSMAGTETVCPDMGKYRLEVSPPGTRNQIIYHTKDRKHYFPERIFEKRSGDGTPKR